MPYSAISPRRANDVVNLAPGGGEPDIAHQRHASGPCRRSAPLMAAMTGLRIVRHEVRMPLADELADVGVRRGVDGGGADRVRSPMSAPAQNARPLPVTTMARTSGSASASSSRG